MKKYLTPLQTNNYYALEGKLIPVDKSANTIEFEIENSGNKNWMPGEIYTTEYTIPLTINLKGNYDLAIQLFDKKSGKPVDVGLNQELKDESGYFEITKNNFEPASLQQRHFIHLFDSEHRMFTADSEFDRHNWKYRPNTAGIRHQGKQHELRRENIKIKTAVQHHSR